jgi:hypothetical protein
MALGTLMAWRLCRKVVNEVHEYFFLKREFYLLSAMSIVPGVTMGFRNSLYRLEGLVPNGLPAYVKREPIKYDYTT